jgi:hypothetical protein
MDSANLSVTSVARRISQSLTSDSKNNPFPQKAGRNCAAATRLNRINSLEQNFRTDSTQKPYRYHPETAQIHPENVSGLGLFLRQLSPGFFHHIQEPARQFVNPLPLPVDVRFMWNQFAPHANGACPSKLSNSNDAAEIGMSPCCDFIRNLGWLKTASSDFRLLARLDVLRTS